MGVVVNVTRLREEPMVTHETSRKPRWRMRRDDKGRLRRVYPFNGVDCYLESYTRDCSGCTDIGDYGTKYGPFGCSECGYTGKRRESIHVPFCSHKACVNAIYDGGPTTTCTAAST